jgi:hypothetical protein
MKSLFPVSLFLFSVCVSGCASLFSFVGNTYSFSAHLDELCLSKLKDGKGTLTGVSYEDAKEWNPRLEFKPFSSDGFSGEVTYACFVYDDKTKDDVFHFLYGNHRNGKFLIREYRWKDKKLVLSCEHFFDK